MSILSSRRLALLATALIAAPAAALAQDQEIRTYYVTGAMQDQEQLRTYYVTGAMQDQEQLRTYYVTGATKDRAHPQRADNPADRNVPELPIVYERGAKARPSGGDTGNGKTPAAHPGR